VDSFYVQLAEQVFPRSIDYVFRDRDLTKHIREGALYVKECQIALLPTCSTVDANVIPKDNGIRQKPFIRHPDDPFEDALKFQRERDKLMRELVGIQAARAVHVAPPPNPVDPVWDIPKAQAELVGWINVGRNEAKAVKPKIAKAKPVKMKADQF
jgi:hypothetical protein